MPSSTAKKKTAPRARDPGAPPRPAAEPARHASKLRPLEFRLFQRLSQMDETRWRGRKILVACSGGADSVALVRLLAALSPRMKFSWAIAHVHHGPDGSAAEAVAQTEKATGASIRDLAQGFVRNLAQDLGIPLFTNSNAPDSVRPASSSEASLRRFRMHLLEAWRREGLFTHLAFAHHADDLAETRLLRLIRGTGPNGLKAMQFEAGPNLRPLLDLTRLELREHLASLGQTWVDDPSNLNVHYLRNWLREEWLPLLETKRPGASRALARSLELMAEKVPTCLTSTDAGQWTLDLLTWRSRPRDEREMQIATCLRELLLAGRVQEFSHRHVLEIAKRLDTDRKVHSFKVLGLTWAVMDEYLRILG